MCPKLPLLYLKTWKCGLNTTLTDQNVYVKQVSPFIRVKVCVVGSKWSFLGSKWDFVSHFYRIWSWLCTFIGKCGRMKVGVCGSTFVPKMSPKVSVRCPLLGFTGRFWPFLDTFLSWKWSFSVEKVVILCSKMSLKVSVKCPLLENMGHFCSFLTTFCTVKCDLVW